MRQMLLPLGQQQRFAPLAHDAQHVPADHLVSRRISSKRLIERLKLEAWVLPGRRERAKIRRSNHGKMSEWARGSLVFGIYAVANRAALHEDDRMMPVLADNRSR